MLVSSPTSSAEEYKRRQLDRERWAEKFEERHVTIGYFKILLVVAILVMAWLSLHHHYFSSLIAVPAVLFIAASVAHTSVLRLQYTAIRAAGIYRQGLARIEDRWPRTSDRVVAAELLESNLYAKDLDIVGKGSLFELLCVARTRMGEGRLLDWLLRPASLETIYQRHRAITELRDQLDFRERMAIVGRDVAIGIDPNALKEWAESSSGSLRPWLRWLALGLAILAVSGICIKLIYGSFLPLLGILVIEWCIARVLKNQTAAILKGLDKACQTLKLFSDLLRELEQQTFATEYLNEIRSALLSHSVAASDAIARLETLVSYKDSLDNLFVKLLDLPLMYTLQLALAVQRWRKQHGSAIGVWLDVLGEFEALLSIAGYSYEHLDDPFPSFTEGPAYFEAHEIGHPLIPAHACVRNSLRMDSDTKVLLISGSNMSGKSTLMRTVGINTVLAMCGGPVRAKQMQLTPLRIGASLLVNDSLALGTSRFYAEIKKLQQICELARQDDLPLLFLLDELLQGTNSKDRLVGADGVLQELMHSSAIGILTTHDLSLTSIKNSEGWIRNMHFQDFIQDGMMQFDFRLRDGVVTKSNGVELMRLIGLKV